MAALIGTIITAELVPTDSRDTFATHSDIYGRGGYRSVEFLADRDLITTERRSIGMLVHVQEDNTTYILIGGIANSNWAVYSAGGGQTQVELKIPLSGKTFTTTLDPLVIKKVVSFRVINASGKTLPFSITRDGLTFSIEAVIQMDNLLLEVNGVL